ncbi:MAG: histidine kinase dimerization/phospho-acceptor domain-containing protein [Myxococcota bacterium]
MSGPSTRPPEARESAWTLPPPPPPVPSAREVLRGLARGTFLAVAGSALLTVGTAATVLPLGFADVAGIARLVGVVSCVVVAVALLVAARELRPTPQLAEALSRRGARPAPEAVLAAFRAPARMLTASLGALALVVGLEAMGLVDPSGVAGPLRVALALLTFGIFQAGLFFAVVGWRGTLWGWLASLDPGAVDLVMRPKLAGRFLRRVLSALVLVVTSLGAVFLAHLEGGNAVSKPALAIGALVSALVLGVGLHVARRLGRYAAEDVATLNGWVRSFTAATGWSGSFGRYDFFEQGFRTTAAEHLSRRVRRLSRTYEAKATTEASARERIESTQRLKTRFMAFMSHDLRSPLSSINGFADILASEMDGPLTREQQDSVAAIQHAGDELLRLVTDIVDSARLEAGRLELHPVRQDPWQLLALAVAEAHARAREDLDLDVDLTGEGLPDVHVDPERTQQALLSVLSHVHRMAPEGGIRLRALPEGEDVAWDVEAPALPPEPERQIFEAFRELRRPSGRRVGGLGLGLALARALMQAQGGDIAYASHGPRGPRFRFTLPRAS